MYTFGEVDHIQERLVKLFPEHKQVIYDIFAHPYGDTKESLQKEIELLQKRLELYEEIR